MAEALLEAAEYFRKNCKRDDREVDILQFPNEAIYDMYQPGLSFRTWVAIVLNELADISIFRFYKVNENPATQFYWKYRDNILGSIFDLEREDKELPKRKYRYKFDSGFRYGVTQYVDFLTPTPVGAIRQAYEQSTVHYYRSDGFTIDILKEPIERLYLEGYQSLDKVEMAKLVVDYILNGPNLSLVE